MDDATDNTRVRVLLAVWAGHGNVGDDLLEDMTVQELHGCDVDSILDASPGDEWSGGRHVWPTDRRLLTIGSVRQMNELRKRYDAVAIVGGFLSDDQSVQTLLRWGIRLFMLGLPVLSLGCGFGPATSRLGGAILGRIGRRFVQPACLRTIDDVNEFRRRVPNGEARLGLDPAAKLDVQTELDERRGTVVSLPPVMDHHEGFEHVSSRRHQLVELLRGLPGPHTFVSFQTKVGSIASDSDAWGWLGLEAVDPLNWRNAVDLLRKAEVVIAGRLHAGIIAAVTGTPTIALSYHRKFRALEAFGLRPITWSDLGAETPPLTPTAVPHDRVAQHNEAIRLQVAEL